MAAEEAADRMVAVAAVVDSTAVAVEDRTRRAERRRVIRPEDMRRARPGARRHPVVHRAEGIGGIRSTAAARMRLRRRERKEVRRVRRPSDLRRIIIRGKRLRLERMGRR